MLAAVVFQTGMEAQLAGNTCAVASGAASSRLIVLTAGNWGALSASNTSFAGSHFLGQGNGVQYLFTRDGGGCAATGNMSSGHSVGPIGPAVPAGPKAIVPADIPQSDGGSKVMQPIHVVDLPPESLPSVSSPNPVHPPIDIGVVFNGPPAVVRNSMPPGESTPPPKVAGSGRSTPVVPPAMAAKPDVEGNRGKSQLFDVAGARGSQPAASPAPGQTESNIVLGLVIGRTVAAGTPVATADVEGPDANIALDSETERTAAEGAIAGDSAAVWAWPPSDRPVAASAAADSSAVVDVKSEEKPGKLLAAGKYYRADIAGLVVLALAGQPLGERPPRPAPCQPRPITLRRQELEE